jgi:hypothetical protein
MRCSLKAGLDAGTDQAFAEARHCRRTLPAAQPLVAFSEQIAAALNTQFPGVDPLAWRALMAAVQSAAAIHAALEPMGVPVTGNIVLNVLALTAEQLDRESGGVPRPAPEAARAVTRAVTRLRREGGGGGHGKALNAAELLLSLHRPHATEEDYAAILAALTGR